MDKTIETKTCRSCHGSGKKDYICCHRCGGAGKFRADGSWLSKPEIDRLLSTDEDGKELPDVLDVTITKSFGDPAGQDHVFMSAEDGQDFLDPFDDPLEDEVSLR